MYSSKEGASAIDLRASSSTFASGSRVSNIPPDPFLGSSPGTLLRRVERANATGAGAKAEALATRAARIAIFDCII
jgi:hypothetical protein